MIDKAPKKEDCVSWLQSCSVPFFVYTSQCSPWVSLVWHFICKFKTTYLSAKFKEKASSYIRVNKGSTKRLKAVGHSDKFL